jgi:hypothetical protein
MTAIVLTLRRLFSFENHFFRGRAAGPFLDMLLAALAGLDIAMKRTKNTALKLRTSATSNVLFGKWKRQAPLGLVALLLLLPAGGRLIAQTQPSEEGFVSLFDGKTLDGWKIGDNAELFQVHDGMIVMDCPAENHKPAHLFYDGSVQDHNFKNFDLRVDVMTYPGANSGIYFHTRFQQAGFPRLGIECQVDNSHSDWRRTGSMYGLLNLTWGPEKPPADNKQSTFFVEPQPVRDNEWYTEEIVYRNGTVMVKLDGKPMLQYYVPEPDAEHRLPTGVTWLPTGTFALQGHPPMPGHISKVCFKNIRVKVLPD